MKKLKLETSYQKACRLFKTDNPTQEQITFCKYKTEYLIIKKLNKLISLIGK